MWTGFSAQSAYVSVREYLPRQLSSTVDRLIPKDRLTEKQFSKIEQLGKNMGLERADIIAAVDGPIIDSGIPGRPRYLLLLNIVIMAVIVAAAVLLVWVVVDPETSPIHTYAPGTFYGTIKPQDFVKT